MCGQLISIYSPPLFNDLWLSITLCIKNSKLELKENSSRKIKPNSKVMLIRRLRPAVVPMFTSGTKTNITIGWKTESCACSMPEPACHSLPCIPGRLDLDGPTVYCRRSVTSKALFVALIKRGIYWGLGPLTAISRNLSEDAAACRLFTFRCMFLNCPDIKKQKPNKPKLQCLNERFWLHSVVQCVFICIWNCPHDDICTF